MGLFSFIGDALGGLTGGALSYKGAKLANETNLRIAREQMGFQRESSREQMAFQERMSNTAYQRAMQDMSSAGINPILAFNQGGASAPSGASSQGASATMQNELSPAVNSAIEARRAFAEVKNLSEQNKQIRSQTQLNNALAGAAKEDARLKSASASKTTTENIRSWADIIGNAAKDIGPWLLMLLRRSRGL